MADIYLRSTDGDDGDDGSTWALAKATLAAAMTAAGVGGKVYVSQAHAESLAGAMTLASPGTAAAPVIVLCVNDGAAPPTALATTATVITTGNNAITFSGFAYCYGVTFRSGDSATGAASINFGAGNYSAFWSFDNCVLDIGTTSATSFITFAGARGLGVSLINTNVKFHATGQKFVGKGKLDWFGGTLDVTSAIPTVLFGIVGGYAGHMTIRGVNLSGLNTALVTGGAIDGDGCLRYRFMNCRLHASVVALAAAIAGPGGDEVRLDNCDSGDTNYKIDHRTYEGSVVQETTIVRTSGASNGTTPFSWKMVSLTGSQLYTPLASPPIAIWNESTGSELTATVEIVHDSLTNLQDDEIWAEVEYLGTSGYPMSLKASDRAASILATPADQTDSSVEWTTTGLTNPNTQKLTVAFTPQEKGPVIIRVMVAKASQTVYVCPKVTVA
jgi:hypothetical protein